MKATKPEPGATAVAAPGGQAAPEKAKPEAPTVLGVLGLALLVAGVAQMSVPGAFIVAGVILLALAVAAAWQWAK